MLQGCTRLAVKLDFIIGLMVKATETAGTRGFRGVEANIGEVIAWRNTMWGLSDAMAKGADPWAGGCVLPALEPAMAYRILAPEAYVQIKQLIEKTVASSLIYLNSHARDFKTPELRQYLDRYVRGSGGVSAVERVKLMKLLWDTIGSEFGARHELYEINYAGSHEEIRIDALRAAVGSGQYERWKGFADQLHGRIRPRRLDRARPDQPRRRQRPRPEGAMTANAASQHFVDVARALAPQIRAAADEIERMRRLPLPLVEAIARAGLFRLWIPRALGGEETDPMTLVRVVEEVSRADGAAGWCVAIGGEYGVFGGYLPADAAREIYGSDPLVDHRRRVSAERAGRGREWRLPRYRPLAARQRLPAFRLDRRRLPGPRRRSATPWA